MVVIYEFFTCIVFDSAENRIGAEGDEVVEMRNTTMTENIVHDRCNSNRNLASRVVVGQESNKTVE